MDPMEVKLPIHCHPVTPLEDVRKGDCCGIKFEALTDGYLCAECDYFFHKACSNPSKHINHPSHICIRSLYFSINDEICKERCGLCGGKIVGYIGSYQCSSCDLKIHLECGKHPPHEVIDVPHNHDHKLKLEMVESCFTCAACGKDGDGYPYKCHECDLAFHVSCEKYAPEVSHPLHSLHPLKLFNGEPPVYSDGKCRLCGKEISSDIFYHCSTCNFTLDLRCVLNPPPLNHLDLNTHDHKLTLVPNLISFACTTCGLHGDRSPYVCLHCNFFAHNDCTGFPRVININRHDHRISHTSLLGVVNAVCGICYKKMDWTCGGYFCKRCPSYVVHTKCATREDVWDGRELLGMPEEDTEPFHLTDDTTIRHFLHPEHSLRLDKSGVFIEERRCEACTYPIYDHYFYFCMYCDYILHESCAKLPREKKHMVSNRLYILKDYNRRFKCEACGVSHTGICYISGTYALDLRCASFSDPFVHQSHPHHPLFYASPRGVCKACNQEAHHVLRCIEDGCEYILDFSCALLPYNVKHDVDDHFLSLCYGREASGKYWCDICETETNPATWFYICDDCGSTVHIGCVLLDLKIWSHEEK